MGITLGKKQLNKGRVSLYLNYSYNGKRRKEYLGIILDAPTSAERRAENKNKILIARQIRAKKELEFLSVEYHLNDIENTFDDILPTDKSNVPDFYILIGQCSRFLYSDRTIPGYLSQKGQENGQGMYHPSATVYKKEKLTCNPSHKRFLYKLS